MGRVVKLSVVAGMLAAVLVSIMALASPPAQAQGQTFPTVQSETYARLHLVFSTESCPASFTLAGATGDDSGTRWCAPSGYTAPISTNAGCQAVIADIGIGIWIDPVCASFGFPMGAGDTCLSPGIQTQFNGNPVCLGPVYARGAGQGGVRNYAQPVCVEDPLVQDNDARAEQRIGERFTGDNGRQYQITTGGPACSFNCESGFDINCDGVLGDYCAVEHDLHTVRGVGQCMADMAPPAPAQPSAAAPTTLAFTGARDQLPHVALWLVGSGTTLLVAARRVRTNSHE